MEETLTDCLVRVREDLSQLRKVREYLETNAETEEHCSVTWRTIEALNSILSVCSSQNTPETNALDTLLDSFYFLARNNTDSSAWEHFGFEIGIICVKILSGIERTEIFELLFCKLLSVISMISEHNSNVWKATARQILNVLINKKFTSSYLEAVLKWYLCIIRNIKSHELHDFSLQNLHLLKTLSMLVQKVGDFDIQSDIIRVIFLHLSKDIELMSDFFAPSEKKFFQSFQFTDFEEDCRLYLNSLNASRRACERKVYSISTMMLFLGGSYVEPPFGRSSIWVDANKDSERLSIKCGDADPTGDRTVYVHFSEILKVKFESGTTEGSRCVTIQTKSLAGLQKDMRNDDICLVTEDVEKVHEFVQFLENAIREYKKKRKFGGKMSQTMDSLIIDRDNPKKETQDNAIISSEKMGDEILPDVMSLFEKPNPPGKNDSPRKTSQTENQKLSPGSFVESLNKHMGLNSPEMPQTVEDSIETVEFFRKSTPIKSHKLFRSPSKIFNVLETNERTNFIFDENKENREFECVKRRSRRNITPTSETSTKVLRDRKNIEAKFSNSQSQDYFQKSSNVKKKKPCLPKLKRNSKANGNQRPENQKSKGSKKNQQSKPEPKVQKSNKQRTGLRTQSNEHKEIKKLEKPIGTDSEEKAEVGNICDRKLEVRHYKTNNLISKGKLEVKSSGRQSELKSEKPSLLDPNGYAYQRWCQPTTSERSNFWLKKLDAMQKSKTNSDVFDFSDEYDSTEGKSKNKKKRIVHSKRKFKTIEETKQTSLREVKNILKNSTTVREKSSLVFQNHSHSQVLQTSPRTEASPELDSSNHISPVKSNLSLETVRKDSDSEYESVLSSEDEEPIQTKKRELSEEENSSAKGYVKKKLKPSISKNLLLSIRNRLQKTEEKDKNHTDEILEVVNKATNHLFNHFQTNNGKKVRSYLKAAEAASLAFDTEIDELSNRGDRIQRAILYYKAGCSVTDIWESLDTHISGVRDALKELRGKKDAVKNIDRICERLSSLVDTEIVKSIKNEWTLKRKKLLRCASVLGVDFKEDFIV